MNKSQKKLKLLSKEQMDLLSTKNLLAYLRRMHKCHECTQPAGEVYPLGVCKSDQAWKDTYALVKSILATREHLP